MRLMRAGHRGYEKPALVAADGSRRDLCIRITDIDETILAGPWWTELGAIDAASLPAIDATARPAALLEQPSAIILASRTGAGRPRRFRLKAGALAGAHDDLRVGPDEEVTARAGLAAVIGRQDGRAGIGGYCLYVDVTVQIEDLDPATLTVASSRAGWLSLGPYLVSPDERQLPAEATIVLDGSNGDTARSSVDIGSAGETVRDLDRMMELRPGSVLLLDAIDEDSRNSLRLKAGSEIRVESGYFGQQRRRCTGPAAPR
jgi:hypothetical protein